MLKVKNMGTQFGQKQGTVFAAIGSTSPFQEQT